MGLTSMINTIDTTLMRFTAVVFSLSPLHASYLTLYSHIDIESGKLHDAFGVFSRIVIPSPEHRFMKPDSLFVWGEEVLDTVSEHGLTLLWGQNDANSLAKE
jgi:hypothetical protein